MTHSGAGGLRSAVLTLCLIGAACSAPTPPAPELSPRASDAALGLPAGWQPVAADRLSGLTDQDWRSENDHHFLAASGDFDGDGTHDTARLLVDDGGSRYALYVTFGGLDTAGPVHRQILTGDVGSLGRLGIAAVPPGRYATACGKGHWACASAEPALLELTTDAVEVIYFEAASTLLYWSGDGFAEIATSD